MVMKAAKVKTIPAGEFKAKCLHLMDEVQQTGISLIVTKRGKPVARVSTVTDPPFVSLYGLTKGSMKILGDIMEPIPDEWESNG